MTTEAITLQTQPRSIFGKKVQTLRRQGITPVHLYGAGQPSLALQVDSAELRRVLLRVGTSLPIYVQVSAGDDPQLVFVRDIQFDPVRQDLLHLDLLRVDVAKMVRVEVPVYSQGDAPAVRSQSGTLRQFISSIVLECLPLEVPEALYADISSLDDFDKRVCVGEIQALGGITVLTSPDQVVFQVDPPVVVEDDVSKSQGAPSPEGKSV
jgi:large subunit ribosomal protein L25